MGTWTAEADDAKVDETERRTAFWAGTTTCWKAAMTSLVIGAKSTGANAAMDVGCGRRVGDPDALGGGEALPLPPLSSMDNRE